MITDENTATHIVSIIRRESTEEVRITQLRKQVEQILESTDDATIHNKTIYSELFDSLFNKDYPSARIHSFWYHQLFNDNLVNEILKVSCRLKHMLTQDYIEKYMSYFYSRIEQNLDNVTVSDNLIIFCNHMKWNCPRELVLDYCDKNQSNNFFEKALKLMTQINVGTNHTSQFYSLLCSLEIVFRPATHAVLAPFYMKKLYNSNHLSIETVVSVLITLRNSPEIGAKCFDTRGVLKLLNKESFSGMCLQYIAGAPVIFLSKIKEKDKYAEKIYSQILTYTYDTDLNIRKQAMNALISCFACSGAATIPYIHIEFKSNINLMFDCIQQVDYNCLHESKLLKLITQWIVSVHNTGKELEEISTLLYPLLTNSRILLRNRVYIIFLLRHFISRLSITDNCTKLGIRCALSCIAETIDFVHKDMEMSDMFYKSIKNSFELLTLMLDEHGPLPSEYHDLLRIIIRKFMDISQTLPLLIAETGYFYIYKLVQTDYWEQTLIGIDEKLGEFIIRFLSNLSQDVSDTRCQEYRAFAMVFATTNYCLSQEERNSISNFPGLSTLCNLLIQLSLQAVASDMDLEKSGYLLLLGQLFNFANYDIVEFIKAGEWWAEELSYLNQKDRYCHMISAIDVLTQISKIMPCGNFDINGLLSYIQDQIGELQIETDVQMIVCKLNRLQVYLRQQPE
jgi:hypothetical protein